MLATVTTTNQNSRLISSSSLRFKPTNRLLDAAAYGRVFKKASRSRDKFFTVLCRENKEEAARLGLAISKKNCRKATGRNRIKRVVRESFRHNKELLTGLDVVVLNQPATTMATNDVLTQSLNKHWQQCASKHRKNTTQDS